MGVLALTFSGTGGGCSGIQLQYMFMPDSLSLTYWQENKDVTSFSYEKDTDLFNEFNLFPINHKFVYIVDF